MQGALRQPSDFFFLGGPLFLPLTPQNRPNMIDSRSDPLAYLSSKWVKAQSSRLILLLSCKISLVAFVSRSDN